MSETAPQSPRYLLVLSATALGVVYGDIGTSPLYALREAFDASGVEQVTDLFVLGILSLMLWSLILVVSIKYLAFVLRADNGGEGGIMALMALVVGRGVPTKLKASLIGIGLFGTALLYGDGVITPAISVLAAVEGLEIAVPRLEAYVVPLAAVILIGLFSVQRRGTAKIGSVFGPVMLLWFSVIAVLGTIEIAAAPEVLKAINPLWALRFVADSPGVAFLAVGAIFLVVTGSEALYADMGHFGKAPIRIGWYAVVLPALALNYLGQGALVLGDHGAIDNPFYRMAPEWAVVPLVILATMATVIASQALISGAFSLTMQAVQLGYLPRQRILHTSSKEFGQIYVPSVNWLLMIGTIALVFSFRTSGNLAAAYGVAVTTTMVITTGFLFFVMRDKWNWPPLAVYGLTGLFLVVDLGFFAANIVKIPAGGWFPLAVGLSVFAVMATWKQGRALIARALRRGDLPIERFIGSIVENPQPRVEGVAVYMFPEPGSTPPALLANLRFNQVLHETIVLVSVAVARTPRIPKARRATVHDLGEGFFQVDLKFGFMEETNVPEALGEIVATGFGIQPDDAIYVIGRESVVPTPSKGLSGWREGLFAFLQRNATNAVHGFKLPIGRVIEVGVQVEI